MKNLKYLLFCQWLCVNLFGIALLVLAYFNGWVELVRVSDPTFLTELIFALSVCGISLSGIRAYKLSREIDEVKSGNYNKSYWASHFLSEKDTAHDIIESIKLRIVSKISIIRWFSNVVVTIGLIGTVLGFIIALSGVTVGVASDVQAVGPMITTLIQGMNIALYTTLVGSIFHVWLYLDYYLIASGASILVSNILRVGSE